MTLPALDIPSRELTRRGRPTLRLKKLRQWIHDLPTANTRKTVHLFVDQLNQFNQAAYTPNDRIQLLDTLRPVARQLLVTLARHLKQARIPLSRKNLDTYHDLHAVLDGMATGYKIIVSELARADSNKEHQQLLLREAIYHSIQYLGRRLLTCYMVYAIEPDNIWHELHQLYRYAESRGFHDQPVDDPAPDYSLPVSYTIDLVYKRALLLSLAEPYHLMPGEADDIHYLVSAWTLDCHLRPLTGQTLTGEFALDLESDQPPRFIGEEIQWLPHDGRIIDIHEVKQRLEAHLQQILKTAMHNLEEDRHSMVLRYQRDMLLRLSDAWRGALKRRTPRHSARTTIRMAMGLNASHHYINRRNDFTPEMDEFVIRYRDKEDIPSEVLATAYEEAMQKDSYHTTREYDANPWWQQNASPYGAALACTPESGCSNVKVGEVVAWCDSRACLHWQLGMVRWLKTRPGEGMELGIMSVANSAVPVAAKGLQGTGEGTGYFRGLLIPKQVSVQQRRSLIVPASVFDINSVLSINMKRRLFYVRLRKLLLSTHSFNQFEFEVQEQPPVDPGTLFIA
ncbi:MAG: hypothetical protein ACLFQT_00280 [Thiohalophilus sp.]